MAWLRTTKLCFGYLFCKDTEVSVAQTIFSLVPVFVLPLAFFFYRERITLKSLLGVFIALVGVIMLIWRNNIQGMF